MHLDMFICACSLATRPSHTCLLTRAAGRGPDGLTIPATAGVSVREEIYDSFPDLGKPVGVKS